MTLFGFTGGKDMELSIGLVSSRPPPVWIAFTRALTVALSRASSVGTSIDTGHQTSLPIYSLWLVWVLTRRDGYVDCNSVY